MTNGTSCLSPACRGIGIMSTDFPNQRLEPVPPLAHPNAYPSASATRCSRSFGQQMYPAPAGACRQEVCPEFARLLLAQRQRNNDEVESTGPQLLVNILRRGDRGIIALRGKQSLASLKEARSPPPLRILCLVPRSHATCSL